MPSIINRGRRREEQASALSSLLETMWCTMFHCLTDKGSSNVCGFILRSTGRAGILVLLGSRASQPC